MCAQREELERQVAAGRQAERQLRQRVAWLEEDHTLTGAAIWSAIIADGAGTLNRLPPQGPLATTVQKLVQVGGRGTPSVTTQQSAHSRRWLETQMAALSS